MSQWKRYGNFCSMYNLVPVPAEVETICLYITHLCDTLKYSTIVNYVSSIWGLHNYMGIEPIAKGNFLISCTLRGARRLLGDAVLTSDPLLPEHLMKLYACMCYSSVFDLVFWSALCLGYRCLLRKCHFTQSTHSIARDDVTFTSYGMCVVIRSSKTIQFSERTLKIPVVSSPGSLLCPVRWLKKYLSLVNVPHGGPLFINPRTRRPLTYGAFTKRLKTAIAVSNIKGHFTSHSLRRGCATYLSRLGLPLQDIKTYGDWRSLSVLLYLSGDHDTRLIKDASVAKSLEFFSG